MNKKSPTYNFTTCSACSCSFYVNRDNYFSKGCAVCPYCTAHQLPICRLKPTDKLKEALEVINRHFEENL